MSRRVRAPRSISDGYRRCRSVRRAARRRATQDRNCRASTLQSCTARVSQQLSQALQGPGKPFIEVMQLNGAAALRRFRIAQDLAQLLARDSLLVLERRARILIDLLLNQELGGADIGGAEIEGAARGIAVAAGAARFLIVAFEALRQVVMNHPTHVRLVDAHSEGDGCDDHLYIVANERLLIVAPGFGVQSRVIRKSADAVGLELRSQSSSTRRRDRQ